MMPTSQTPPRNAREAPTGFLDEVPTAVLADAFSEFIAAAARLEGSYSELQQQVAQLGVELAERNAALNASLAENERMRLALEQVVDSMPCGVMVLEQGGALTRINPEGLRLLGLEPGHTGVDTLADISARAGIELASFLADDRIAEGAQEFSLAAAGGDKRWIEVRNRRLFTSTAVRGANVAAGGLGWQQTILILRDVTAHKQAEQERERARRASALAEIAAMLAHEIRNPLASLELFAGLLADSDSLQSSRGAELEWIAHMRAGIRSLSGTVNNVLSFHGAGFPALARLDLASAIAASVAFVRPIADQAGVALSFDVQAEHSSVLGNESALQQVLLNLVANAVRHTSKGGSVRITLSLPQPAAGTPGVPAGRIRLSVADTGTGIRPENLGDIFRAGFSGSGNSSGLGLAVCRQIVRQHDGELHVTSQPGVGSTFSVELPTL